MKKISPDLRADLFVLLNVELLFPFIVRDKHIYDVPTAFFFTLALGLLKRERFTAYALLFPLICLNRETAILLTLFFGVYFFQKMAMGEYLARVGYQALVYAAIRIYLFFVLAEAPGVTAFFRPVENLRMYIEYPILSAIFLLCVSAVLLLVILKWPRADRFLRTAFLTVAPALALIYLIFGVTFEYRVFLELFPVVMIMVTA
jgi:hypothetical protein